MYGSLQNRLLERTDVDPEVLPAVGDGATVYLHSDRNAYTVVAVTPGKRPVVDIQRDRTRRTDALGMADSGQRYEFVRDPEGPRAEVTIQRGAWRIKGNGPLVRFGVRDEFYDFTF